MSLTELVVSPQHDQQKTKDIKQKYIGRSDSKNVKREKGKMFLSGHTVRNRH